MALRIGGSKPVAPLVEEEQLSMEEMPVEEAAPMPEDLMAELPESLEEEPAAGGGDVDPMQVFYKSGEQRMAEACENCKHFLPESACSIVAGPIDPAGICNIYTPMAQEEEEMPMEEEAAPMPEEEVPVEEPLPTEGY